MSVKNIAIGIQRSRGNFIYYFSYVFDEKRLDRYINLLFFSLYIRVPLLLRTSNRYLLKTLLLSTVVFLRFYSILLFPLACWDFQINSPRLQHLPFTFKYSEALVVGSNCRLSKSYTCKRPFCGGRAILRNNV